MYKVFSLNSSYWTLYLCYNISLKKKNQLNKEKKKFLKSLKLPKAYLGKLKF